MGGGVDQDEPHLRKFQKELSAGTVSLALLAVLGTSGEPMYGYQIAKTLERFGQGVLSDMGGASEMIEHGVDGMVVPAGDTEALTSALSDLYDSGELRRRLGAAARGGPGERRGIGQWRSPSPSPSGFVRQPLLPPFPSDLLIR